MDNTELITLLAEHKMTFYWGTVKKVWWIVGQVANGCAQNTVPAPAENFNAAQAAAVHYIHEKNKFRPSIILWKMHV